MGVFNWYQIKPKRKIKREGKLVAIINTRTVVLDNGEIWQWFTDNGHQTWLYLASSTFRGIRGKMAPSPFVNWENSLNERQDRVLDQDFV